MSHFAHSSANVDTQTNNETPAKTPLPHWQRELLWSAGGITAGLSALPVVIYVVGSKLLGDYGGGGTLGSFFQHFFSNLLSGSLAAWSIAVGPTLISAALRYALTPRRKSPQPTEGPVTDTVVVASTQSTAQNKTHPTRREPFIGS